jgi:hypothetical protein
VLTVLQLQLPFPLVPPLPLFRLLQAQAAVLPPLLPGLPVLLFPVLLLAPRRLFFFFISKPDMICYLVLLQVLELARVLPPLLPPLLNLQARLASLVKSLLLVSSERRWLPFSAKYSGDIQHALTRLFFSFAL